MFDEKLYTEISSALKLGTIATTKSALSLVINKLLCLPDNFNNTDFARLSRAEKDNLIHQVKRLEEAFNRESVFDYTLKNKLIKQLYEVTYQPSIYDKERQRLEAINVSAELVANKLSSIYDQRFEFIEKCRTYSLQERLGDIILFSCSFAGLSHQTLLEALRNKLLLDNKPLQQIGGRFFIELHYEISTHPTSVVEDNRKRSHRRFYPDYLTLLSIFGFLKIYNKNKDCKTLKSKSINSLLLGVLKQTSLGISRIEKFTFEGLLIAGARYKRFELPLFLRKYAVSDISSAPISLDSLLSHYDKKRLPKDLSNIIENKLKKQTPNSVQTIGLGSAEVTYNKDQTIIDEIKTICALEHEETVMQDREVTISKLKGLRTKYDFNLQTEIFFEWIVDGLSDKNRWEVGKNTAVRYVNAIGHPWVTVFRDYDIREVGQDEMDILYEAILENRERPDSAAPIALDLLFKYISKRYTISIPEFLEENGSRSHVRSQVIPESHFQLLRHEMRSLYKEKSSRFKTALDALLIIIRRCFLRPSEAFKLLMWEIETSDDLIIHIHKNKIGRVKTVSADRVINASLFLRNDEEMVLNAYIGQRKMEVGNVRKAPLFVQDASGCELFCDDIVNRPAIEILSSLANERVSFYQNRHSGISELQLIMFADELTTIELTGLTAEQIANIKQNVQLHPNDHYYQISSLAGHINPKTTAAFYSHFTDIILHDVILRKKHEFNLKFWTNLTNLRPTSIDKTKIINDNGAISAEKIIKQLVPRLQEYCMRYAKDIKRTASDEIAVEPFKPDLSRCEAVLKSYEAGNSVQDICDAYCIPVTFVSAVIFAAEFLKEDPLFRTSKNQSRLFPSMSQRLAPVKIYEKSEDIEKKQMLNVLLSLAERRPKLIKQKLIDVLSSVDNSHSYIKFTSMRKLISHINFFSDAVKTNRWYCVVQPRVEAKNQKWVTELKDILDPKHLKVERDKAVKNHKLLPEGRAFLYYLDRDAEQKVSRTDKDFVIDTFNGHQDIAKFSSNAFKVATHWALILIIAKERYLEMQNEPIRNDMQLPFRF